ncbi:phage tail tape measure protein [Algicella marina]|uniref:Phage tail tape measure protein n=1 Tax=Algicella marina TaxID=2683284 RepID=A0A6P1SZV1_9RHOB|nr:phage tail tape measure protein [Algicella marina]QHQ34559.1 phage tail tape measure protein [Algicella marina]
MPDFNDSLDNLETRLVELEDTITGTEAMTAAFRAEMEDVGTTMRDASVSASGLSRSFGTSLKNAFTGLIFDGDKLSNVMTQVGRSFSNTVLNAALKPVTGAIGGLLSSGFGNLFGGGFAKGGVMTSGRVQAFAKGGVVDGPMNFGLRGGRIGLMGEAGPEAIMPLTRGADGSLGVRAAGGSRGVHVTMNVTTPDVAGFSRSQSQIAAQMSRAMRRSGRNL